MLAANRHSFCLKLLYIFGIILTIILNERKSIMKTRRAISVICAVILILSACFIAAAAQTGNTKITVGSVEADAGDTVQVDVSIKNNPGILGAMLSVDYDEGLTLIDAQSGEAFSALTMTKPGRYEPHCNFTWDGIDISSSDIKDGKILTLVFSVDSAASAGHIYNISVSGEDGDIVDTDLNEVSPTFEAGKITIKSQEEPVEPPTDGTTFTVGSVHGAAGETVDVNVSISGNPGILGAILSVTYDERLTLVNSAAGPAFSALSMTKPGAYTSPCNFTWDGVDLEDGDIKDGVVLTLSFRVPDSAGAGDVYNIAVSSEEGNIVDSDINTVLPEFRSGSITVDSSAVSDSVSFTVDSAEGTPGGTVDVNISIANNPGILGAKLTLSYDEGLTLKNATAGAAFSALAMTKPGHYSSPCNFTWDGIELSESDIKDGIVLTLSFEVSSSAAAGDVFNISVSSADDDIVDSDLQPVQAEFVAGGITVSHEHTYVTSVVEPTCEEKGYTQYTCSVCHNIYKTDYIDEIGHYYHYTGDRQNPVLTYECEDCGKEYSVSASEVYAMWNSYYVNRRPNSTDNRTKTDNSSLINVVADSRVNDGIINGKDYGVLMRLAEKENNQ